MMNFRDSLFKLEFIYSSSTGEEKGFEWRSSHIKPTVLSTVCTGRRMQLDSAEGTELA